MSEVVDINKNRPEKGGLIGRLRKLATGVITAFNNHDWEKYNGRPIDSFGWNGFDPLYDQPIQRRLAPSPEALAEQDQPSNETS